MIRIHYTTARLLLAALLVLPGTAWAQRSPTVAFEAGLGDDAKVWRKTIEAMPGTIPVFSYDRPGYGQSPKATTPRDPCTIATELHARLLASGQAPPYVLVGHSLGGQYAYAFARLFPHDVAGLVLVDATAPGRWRTIERELPADASMVRLMKATVFFKAMRGKFEAQDQCLDSLPPDALAISHPSAGPFAARPAGWQTPAGHRIRACRRMAQIDRRTRDRAGARFRSLHPARSTRRARQRDRRRSGQGKSGFLNAWPVDRRAPFSPTIGARWRRAP